MTPHVSIIMATYNRANLIRESLVAIKDQTFLKWECLIIDDGSTDNSEEIINEFLTADSRFIYMQRPVSYRKGLPGCRNLGLDKAKGKFVVFFDDDDIPHPQVLELAVGELNSSYYDFCRYLRNTFHGKYNYLFERITDYNKEIIGLTQLDDIVQNKLPFNSCQVVWRKSSIGKSRFEETLMYAEEWEFYSRILTKGMAGISIDKVLYFGRKHPDSNTGEFQNKIPVRVASQLKAAELVINRLAEKSLYTENLKKYFLRMGFALKSYSLVKLSLKAANVDFLEKWRYKLGFQIYPVLKPIFNLKDKISRH